MTLLSPFFVATTQSVRIIVTFPYLEIDPLLNEKVTFVCGVSDWSTSYYRMHDAVRWSLLRIHDQVRGCRQQDQSCGFRERCSARVFERFDDHCEHGWPCQNGVLVQSGNDIRIAFLIKIPCLCHSVIGSNICCFAGHRTFVDYRTRRGARIDGIHDTCAYSVYSRVHANVGRRRAHWRQKRIRDGGTQNILFCFSDYEFTENFLF